MNVNEKNAPEAVIELGQASVATLGDLGVNEITGTPAGAAISEE